MKDNCIKVQVTEKEDSRGWTRIRLEESTNGLKSTKGHVNPSKKRI